ncbi:DUF6518 family protein [Mangrovihabitans endophyticus]|uniref:Uncharacterized protein n=1 Tax=Mangrovihabitans endophyticus TaxID=1751298 RepID=A0A8J3FSF9_9ACTN|nr:DUF6518 family protein [Mangrovihabitans endophyticus]GGL14327.1 hypothetical protein GCM10012284_56350 [Mangrovihabitans endophyticus]
MRLSGRKVAIGAVLGGFCLGFLDFMWIKFMPYPFADLGNSMAVWALAAFFFGWWVRDGWARAAVGAATMLVVGVPSYDLAAALIQHDDWAVMWSVVTIVWMALGVAAGIVFGIGGVWAHDSGWRRLAGIALPGAVLFAESIMLARRIANPSYGTDSLWPALIDAALGLLVVMLVARRVRERAAALALAAALGVVGWVAFGIAGIG